MKDYAPASPKQCPRCGALVEPSRFDGLCPACTWESLAGPELSASRQSEARGLFQVPGYVVLEELARGGMGIVYRALQEEPEREVALKMLLPQQLAAPGLRDRFRIEAKAIAGLDHHGILPVYEVGEYHEMPFFTMKLAAGGTLAGRLDSFAARFREIASLIAEVADAIQYAHEHGVLHRDLKPGNILFDAAGRAYVSDFGLAKLAGTDSELTRSADVLGTPQYLAPEVAAANARSATIASDVYSLGAILYELLSGRPPFHAEGVPALMRKIAEQEPVPLPNRVPRDLAVICLKALAKEPGRRYGSARELSEDLRRWMAGQPIVARPVSRAERLWQWGRRNPLLAATSAALILSLLGGGIALVRSYQQVRGALAQVLAEHKAGQLSLRDALVAQATALGAAHSTGQRWQALEALAQAARIQPSTGLRNEAAAGLARADLKELQRFAAPLGSGGTPVVFSSNLAWYILPNPAGGFESREAISQRRLAEFHSPRGRAAKWFVLSDDDQHVAALLEDYSMEIWSLNPPRLLQRWDGNIHQPPVAAFHPDGRSVAAFVPGAGVFIQALDGTERRSFFTEGARAIYLRFDPLGKTLAVVRDPGGVQLWDCQKDPKLIWTHRMQVAVPWVAWSPDASRLAVAADDGRGLRILSSTNGQIELAYSKHLAYPRQFEFSPNGRQIASLGEDWSLRVWDSRSGQDLVVGVGRHRVLRFSRDGRRLTTAPTDQEVAILELAPESVFREFSSTPAGSQITCRGLARIPDGLLMVANPEVRVYDTRGRRELLQLDDSPSPRVINAVADSAGGLLYGREGQGIFERPILRATNASTGDMSACWGEERLIAPCPQATLWNTAQGGHALVSDLDGAVELWPERDPSHAQRVRLRKLDVVLATSQDGRWAAVLDPGQSQLTIFDFRTGQPAAHLPTKAISGAWFSPDSRWLVVSTAPGYQAWSTSGWKPRAAWPAKLDSGASGEVTFSDDSRLVAARYERQTFQLLSFPEGRELVTLRPPLLLPVRSACLSGDGSRLWLLASGYRLFEWNLAELQAELGKMGLDWRSGSHLPP